MDLWESMFIVGGSWIACPDFIENKDWCRCQKKKHTPGKGTWNIMQAPRSLVCRRKNTPSNWAWPAPPCQVSSRIPLDFFCLDETGACHLSKALQTMKAPSSNSGAHCLAAPGIPWISPFSTPCPGAGNCDDVGRLERTLTVLIRSCRLGGDVKDDELYL